MGFLNALNEYLEKHGLWDEYRRWIERSIEMVRVLGDNALFGGLLNDLGLCYRQLGQPALAVKYFEQCLEIRRRFGPKAGEAVALNNLGLVHDDLGERHQTVSLYERLCLRCLLFITALATRASID